MKEGAILYDINSDDFEKIQEKSTQYIYIEPLNNKVIFKKPLKKVTKIEYLEELEKINVTRDPIGFTTSCF